VTITGAVSKIDCSPAPPCTQWTVTFVPSSSWISGASSAIADSMSVTAFSSVTFALTASAASRACSRVSASTTATASPLNRIRSFVSG